MSEQDGGPAFPGDVEWLATDDSKPYHRTAVRQRGMSLRDYFAGQAMVGLLASRYVQGPDVVASYAYEYADAMLEARKPK
jgi:hypothetical protein